MQDFFYKKICLYKIYFINKISNFFVCLKSYRFQQKISFNKLILIAQKNYFLNQTKNLFYPNYLFKKFLLIKKNINN